MALRTQHPAPPTTPAVPGLIEVDHPGLMAGIDHEPVADDLTIDRFPPACQQASQGQPGALLNVCPDDVFLPPPATPGTHDDPLDFGEMIMFYHLGSYSICSGFIAPNRAQVHSTAINPN